MLINTLSYKYIILCNQHRHVQSRIYHKNLISLQNYILCNTYLCTYITQYFDTSNNINFTLFLLSVT